MHTLLFMTSNHTQLKQLSFTAFVRRDVARNVSDSCRFDYRDVARYVSTCDSPRFATLPQYTNHTEPYTYYLSAPFLSQQIAKHDVCMMEPNSYLRLTLAAKAYGLPEARICSFNNKYLLLIN